MIMVRTLRRDIARYNSDEGIDDMMEETGWKLVHGDVFRPPPKRMLFAAVIGSGIQIFLMALITICKLLLFNNNFACIFNFYANLVPLFEVV